MAATTSSDLSSQYQSHFSKKLLDHAQHELRLNEFAVTEDLPKNMASKKLTFFRPPEADASKVQTLTEGTPTTERRNVVLTAIEATLVQYGEVAEITDIVSWTDLFKALTQHISTMGEDCALHADGLSRNALVSGLTTTANRRYSQGLANFAALEAAAAVDGAFVRTDGLAAATQLKVNRAPKFGGKYVCVIPPQVSHDFMQDEDWLSASKYGSVTQLFKGELGELDGVRYVEATNPFIEDDTLGTYDAAGGIFTSLFLSKGAFGTPKLSGTSPFKPQVIICDKADKSDPLNQKLMAGWKAFWTAKLLNANWAIAMRSRSTFA